MRSTSCRKVDCEHWEKLREEKVVLLCVACRHFQKQEGYKKIKGRG